MAAARASGLVKTFGSIRALDGVGIEVGEGEIRGLLGPNGAGKTTLLRLLFGLLRSDAGSIELLGQARSADDPRPPYGVGGFIEEPTFYPYLSGRANLELLAELDGGTSAAVIDAALQAVGLESRAGDRTGGYSTGMRQRLGIAASLLRAPRLLLLDEPTSGLDPAGARAVGALLQELARGGTAVLISSHLIGEIEHMCDAFTVLSEGRVVWDGTIEELRVQAPASAFALRTSDDERALMIAARFPEIGAGRGARGGLRLTAREEDLDPFVLALGAEHVAVRALELVASPLESMFFALTGGGEAGSGGAQPLDAVAGSVSR